MRKDNDATTSDDPATAPGAEDLDLGWLRGGLSMGAVGAATITALAQDDRPPALATALPADFKTMLDDYLAEEAERGGLSRGGEGTRMWPSGRKRSESHIRVARSASDRVGVEVPAVLLGVLAPGTHIAAGPRVRGDQALRLGGVAADEDPVDC